MEFPASEPPRSVSEDAVRVIVTKDFSLQSFVTPRWKLLLDFHRGLCSAPASRGLSLQAGVGKTLEYFCSHSCT